MNTTGFFHFRLSPQLRMLMVVVWGSALVTASMPRVSISATVAVSFPVADSLIVDEPFTDAELDQLLGPIALYPDPLLAQVVPAATFVEQIQEAQGLLGGKIDEDLIDKQSWDVSVKSVAHYPKVLEMMNNEVDWTTSIGQAYVNQSTDVGKSIQRLRAEAKASGALVSNEQQKVTYEKDMYQIVPAQPQVIYVPQYDPQVVYVDSGPSTGAVIASTMIAFGTGLAMGAWLNRDWDWWGRGPYYHGWVGGGWIGYGRPFYGPGGSYYRGGRNNIYINNSFTNINVNRTVVNRNVSSYRANVRNRSVTNNRLDINRGNASRDFNRNRTNTNLPNNAGDRIGNTGNRLNDTGNRINNNTGNRINNNAGDRANRAATNNTNRAKNAANTANRTGNRAANSANKTANRTANSANKTANRAANSANKTANRAANSANKTVNRANTNRAATPKAPSVNRSAPKQRSAPPRPSGGAKVPHKRG